MKCESANCDKVANFQCPTCLKLGISGSYFCSQECFKGYWRQHKVIHAMLEKSRTVENSTEISWPSFSFTGPLRPHKQTPKREVPPHITRPDYADHEKGIPMGEREAKAATTITILNEEEIEAMRLVGKLSREILEEGVKAIEVGVTTDEIDRIVHEACIERECYPSPLNYYNFPKSCCTSINEVICHGIPDLRPLVNGDIVNLDVTAYHRGFHGDLNETVFVGQASEESKKLVQATYECLSKAIAMVSPGVKYRDVGDVITQTASKHGLSVVRTYCGHGVHRLFHCPPNVPHYSKNKAVGVMKPGHCFTIEPMINAGQWRDKTWLDNWTATTVDGQRSAQFEDTLLVTESGVEVLTRRRTGGGRPYFMDQLETMK